MSLPGDLAKALSALKPIRWVCYGRARLETRRPPQLLGTGVYGVDATPNGFVVFHGIYDLNGNPHSVVEEITRDYRILWSKVDLISVPTYYCSVVYNWENGRVLLCNGTKVVEYDPKADKVTLELTEFSGIGPFKRVVTATYEYESPPTYHTQPYGAKYTGNIWVVDRDAHFIALMDRNGNVLASFGTYNQAGNGLKLNYPFWAEGSRERCTIADSGNHRVFMYNFTTSQFVCVWGYPNPRCYRVMWGDRYLVSSFRGGAPTICITGSMFEMISPFTGLESQVTYTPLGTVAETWHTSIVEYNPSACLSLPRQPVMPISIADLPRAANTSTGLYPFWPEPYNRCQIQVMSTQTATLNIYVLKTVQVGMYPYFSLWAQPDANGNLQWQLFDSLSLTANTLTVYNIDNPIGLMAVEVVMGPTAGSVDLRVLLR
jgi:hypothetical protein